MHEIKTTCPSTLRVGKAASSCLQMVRISSNNLAVTPYRITTATTGYCVNRNISHMDVIPPSFLLSMYQTSTPRGSLQAQRCIFEALGPNLGAACLRKVIKSIPDDIPVLLDVKRGDIGSTAQAYAEACYEREEGLNADGVTLSPLMGWDSVQPFVTGEYFDVE